MIIIRNGTLVTEEGLIRADLALDQGKIAKIGEIPAAEGDEVADAEGCLVYPGFIDGHTHLDLPVAGTVTADDFESGLICPVKFVPDYFIYCTVSTFAYIGIYSPVFPLIANIHLLLLSAVHLVTEQLIISLNGDEIY